jgi:hypothetical protein
MTMVAIQNFRSVDRLLLRPAPTAAEQIRSMGHAEARAFLRYQVSEQNRWYFQTWELLQLAIGGGLFGIVLFATRESKSTLLLCLLMIVAVAIERLLLTPEIIALGRVIDFVPADAPSPERGRFWVFHSTYSAVELTKWLLGLVLAGKLIIGNRHSVSMKHGLNVWSPD